MTDSFGTPITITSVFTQGVEFNYGRNWLRVVNQSKTPVGDWEESTYSYATDYDVLSVNGRQSDEFYVGGRSRSGEDIIEKWSITTHVGGHQLLRKIHPTPIGVPKPGVPATTIGIAGGGEYLPASQRAATPRQTRLEIYRGNAFGGIVSVFPDPDGRFVIVVGENPRALYRVPIEENGTPTLLYTTAEVPMLAYVVSMSCAQHYSAGRVYRYTTHAVNGIKHKVLFFDADNDGNFDSTLTMARDEYEAAGYAGAVWLTDFLNE